MTNFENYNMETFISEVMFEIGRLLPEKYKNVNVRKVNKTNVIKTGMTLSDPENGISPTIYLDDFYEKAASMTIPEIAKEIVDTFVYYIENIPEEMRAAAIAQKFLNFDNVKDKLILSVISASRNTELLMGVPHKLIGDMAIIYKILVDADPRQTATANVNYDMLAAWGKTFEELYPLAKENSQKLLGSICISMEDFLRQEMGCMPTPLFEEAGEEEDFLPPLMIPMHIISNKRKVLGAAAIFYGDELSTIAEKYESDLFILPSSIHEVIAIPVCDGSEDDAVNLLDMVKEVNTTTVDSADQLTDEVYIYHREDGSITVAATDCVAAA